MIEELKETIQEKIKKYNNWLVNNTSENWNTFKAHQRVVRSENKLRGTRSTDVWVTLRKMKTNGTEKNQNLVDTEQWKSQYENLLTESRTEFLYEVDSLGETHYWKSQNMRS